MTQGRVAGTLWLPQGLESTCPSPMTRDFVIEKIAGSITFSKHVKSHMDNELIIQSKVRIDVGPASQIRFVP